MMSAIDPWSSDHRVIEAPPIELVLERIDGHALGIRIRHCTHHSPGMTSHRRMLNPDRSLSLGGDFDRGPVLHSIAADRPHAAHSRK